MLHHDVYICVCCEREAYSADVDPDTACEASSTDLCAACRPHYGHLVRSRYRTNDLHYTAFPRHMQTTRQIRWDDWDHDDYQNRMEWDVA